MTTTFQTAVIASRGKLGAQGCQDLEALGINSLGITAIARAGKKAVIAALERPATKLSPLRPVTPTRDQAITRQREAYAQAYLPLATQAGRPDLAVDLANWGMVQDQALILLTQPRNIIAVLKGETIPTMPSVFPTLPPAAGADVAALCTAAGEPDLAAGFIRQGLTLEKVRELLGAARDIRMAVRAARLFGAHVQISDDRIAEFIRAGTPFKVVAAYLNEKMVDAAGPETSNHRDQKRHAAAPAKISDKVMSQYTQKPHVRVPAGSTRGGDR